MWFTAFVAVVIFAAFVLTAVRFATIAQDAQDELINVRIGSVLDAFVLFAPDSFDDPTRLRAHMQEIVDTNETLTGFSILARHSEDWRVYIDLDPQSEGQVLTGTPVIFSLAVASPSQAFTFPGAVGSERIFTTARAITENGKVAALAVTTQHLAVADERITRTIKNSMYALLGVLALIMALFFRHARIIDYAQLYRKQREIDAMKDSFISMASHELKSPLSVIRGYVSFLKDGTGGREAQSEYLRRIDVSAEELRQLIDDILDVSRIEQGRMSVAPTRLHPYEVITEVIEMFREQAVKKALTLTLVSSSTSQQQIIVDRARFKQVLINLVSNAVKYTKEGSIIVSLEVDEDNVLIEVQDTGIGLSAEEQQHLFKKFYRATSEESKGVPGTGLGLWITASLVKAMGGSISVESMRGVGSKFVLAFPVQNEA